MRCRRLTLDIRPREMTEEVLKSSWDSAQEEKMRLEIERRRKRVIDAQQRSEEAVRALDRARKEHLVLDEELRKRSNFPDIPEAFIETLPLPQSRDGLIAGAGEDVAREDVGKIEEERRKKAIEDERKKADKMRAELEEKVKEAERKWRESEEQLKVLQTLSRQDKDKQEDKGQQEETSASSLEILSSELEESQGKRQADMDAARFDGKMFEDGMMVMSLDWTRQTDLSLTSSLRTATDVQVFTEGEQTAIFQDGEMRFYSQTADETDDVSRSSKV
mmetsp:Transcript_2922/g.6995  ORF Transcript_2922/g.6995 Transcript_2922/m.6995 type:complete len:276 (-) Transcript_2922:105-932(-)